MEEKTAGALAEAVGDAAEIGGLSFCAYVIEARQIEMNTGLAVNNRPIICTRI